MAKTTDGRTMVLVRSSAIYLWHAETPNDLTPVELLARPAPSPANKGSRRQAQGINDGFGPMFRSIQISPRGDRIYAIETGPGFSTVLRVWVVETPAGSTSTRARPLDLPAPVSGGVSTLPEGMSTLALRPDGKVLAVGDRTGRVTLLDSSNLAVLGWLKRPGTEIENLVPALAYSPDGTELAVGSQQGAISLWSVVNPSQPHLRLSLPGHRGMVTNLAYDRQGRRLASAGFDPIVEVWDFEIIERELMRLGLAD